MTREPPPQPPWEGNEDTTGTREVVKPDDAAGARTARARAVGGVSLDTLAERLLNLDDEEIERQIAPHFLVLFVGAKALERAPVEAATAFLMPTAGLAPRRLSAGAQAFPLRADDELRIGRGEECEVQIDHASVSRQHAVVRSDGVVVSFRDLGSKNGSAVGEIAVERGATVAVTPGAELKVGEVRLSVLAAPVMRAVVERLSS